LKKLFAVILFLSSCLLAQYNSASRYPGSFSRMGFSGRGIGMGNALTAVIDGNLSGYYNPAVSSFQKDIIVSAGYTYLSLDRNLNFFSFGKNFELGKKRDEEGNWSKPKSIAGISVGLINSGVSGIERRDNQGIKTGDISTSENLFFVAVSNQFSDKVSVGLNIKFYYFKLYESITSTGVGFDAGLLYRLNDNLTLAAVFSDINSKYKWNTNEIYGTLGSITEDKFPLRKKFAASYNFRNIGLLLSAEYEMIDSENNYFRTGAEYEIIKRFIIRGGVDNVNVSNSDIPVKPSFGFSYEYLLDDNVLSLDYAYGFEPYSPFDFHVVSLNYKF